MTTGHQDLGRHVDPDLRGADPSLQVSPVAPVGLASPVAPTAPGVGARPGQSGTAGAPRPTGPDPAEVDWAAHDAALADLDPRGQAEGSIRWAVDTFGLDGVILASSMGDEVLVHLASEVAPGIRVLFLDTGYHFAETIGTREAFAASRPIDLINLTPRRTVAEQDAEHGQRLHERNPDLCCALRKVEPLERGLSGYPAWITGMRRVDAPTRSDIGVIGWDTRRQKVKLNPLAAWSDADVAGYAEANGVLLNPLREEGYTSIGCQPCTRPIQQGADPRSGRWAGRAKTECGLHT